MKISTNLTIQEILTLKIAGFQLSQRVIISPKKLFGGEEALLDLLSHPTPVVPNDHSNKRSDKNIRKNKKTPSTKYANNWHLL
jgi:hypothetical protein